MKKIIRISIIALLSLLFAEVQSYAATPAITFNGFNLTVTGPSVDLSTQFTTDSDGEVSFAITGTSSTITGTILTGLSAGTVTVTGYVASTAGFDLDSAQITVTVLLPVPINPSVTFSGFDVTVGGGNVDLTTKLQTNSTGVKSFFINGNSATLNGSTLAAIKGGSVSISWFLSSAVGFNAASGTTTVTIFNQNPSITFGGFSLTIGGTNGASVNLTSVFLSNSTGAKSFTVVGDTTVAKLVGTTLTALGLGSVTVTGTVKTATGFNQGTQTYVVNVVLNPTPTLDVPISVSGLYGLVRRSAVNQEITITGFNLTGNVTVTSPVSLRISSPLVTTAGVKVVQPISAGNVNLVLQIALTNTNTAGTISGVLTVTSSGLKKIITVYGEVVSSTIVGITGISISEEPIETLTAYPNPVEIGQDLNFNAPVSGVLFSASGSVSAIVGNQYKISTNYLTPGIYLFKSNNGQQVKISVKQ